MEKLAEDFFDPSISARDHAIFEVGIKLAAVFHLMMGTPIRNDKEVRVRIADGLKAAISCQPFVKRVDVEIKEAKSKFGQKYDKEHEFDYTYISAETLVAEVEVQYENWKAIGRLEWLSDLEFPLMYIKKIENLDSE